MTNEQTIDCDAIERLRKTGGNKFVVEMVDIFLRNVTARLAESRTAQQAGNLEPAERTGHSLKSSCVNLGALAMREVALALERAARDGQTEAVSLLLNELEAALAAVRPALEAVKAEASVVRTVAVVEDNPDNRLLMRALLRELYEVAEYETGPEALEGLKRQRPHLVLLDISLPGMDGIEVLRNLRADATLRALPVIALTANAMSGDREKYMAAGFDEYVPKPIVDETILLNAIARLMRP